MACECQFDQGFKLECLKEIIADIVSKNVTVSTVQKALWTVGCALTTFQTTTGSEPVAAQVEGFMDVSDIMTEEELVSKIENAFAYHSDGQKAIDPATIIALIQLVMPYLLKLLKH